MEQYIKIKDFPDYEVSDHGNVRNKKGKILISAPDQKGYLMVGLRKENKTYTKRVARLVAISFIPNPENKKYVNHIDNNPSNNEVSNLEWNTQAENISHAVKQGRFNQGTLSPRTKFTEEQILEIRKRIANKEISQCKLAKELGVTQNCISEIVNRLTWKHI